MTNEAETSNQLTRFIPKYSVKRPASIEHVPPAQRLNRGSNKIIQIVHQMRKFYVTDNIGEIKKS